MIALGLWLALSAPATGCHPIEDVRLFGRDLAAADPAFADLAPSLFVGYSPVPGAQRVMPPAELARIAKAHGLEIAEPAQLCFEWQLSRVEPNQIVAAMRRVPGLASAKIEVLEADRHPTPRGEIVFPATALVQSSAVYTANGVVWRGYVQYAGSRRFPIWARVKISVATKRIVATRSLRAGETIAKDDVRAEDYEGFAFHATAATRIEDVVGQTPRRAVRSGDIILTSLVEPRKDIKKGDPVQVKVDDGNVRFRLEGRAEAAGRRGDLIQVRNMASGKTFQARVQEPGIVTVSLRPVSIKGSSE